MHDAGDQAVAILARDYLGTGEVHIGDQAVGGAEVDAYDRLGPATAEIDLENGRHQGADSLSTCWTRLEMYLRRLRAARMGPSVAWPGAWS